ncbi:hypothetical protein L6452_36261 [Arctium lappa]|uniref:Uncharacterized protein n=1 Tax=Arctium lappa TaxID=4217 RepID=A0ACB8Y8P0_ARCLA|nr:hypothetical protein L6452_36261 [Arctium lappa]
MPHARYDYEICVQLGIGKWKEFHVAKWEELLNGLGLVGKRKRDDSSLSGERRDRARYSHGPKCKARNERDLELADPYTRMGDIEKMVIPTSQPKNLDPIIADHAMNVFEPVELDEEVLTFAEWESRVGSAAQLKTMKQVCDSSKLELAQLRLLEVDNRVVVPAKSHLRIAGPPPPKNNKYHHSRQSASIAYNVNPVADQFQRAFQTSTFCNRLYSFFNKRWFFDQVFNDFLVRSFLRFGYEVSFEALDKGAIEILGPYECVMTRGRLPGGGGSPVVGKRETRLYEPEERLHNSSRGIKTGAFCSASRNASE